MEEAGGLVCEVWESNWPSALAFSALATQWRMGSDGPIGLDYTAIPPTLRLIGIGRSQWPQVFDDVRVMEDAALKFFSYMRNRRGR